MTKDQEVRALLGKAAAFYPTAGVSERTLDVYAEKLRPHNSGKVRRVLEEWVDKRDHWPAWCELREALIERVPRSLSDQNRSPILEEIESKFDLEEAKSVLDSGPKVSAKSSSKREGESAAAVDV